MLLLTACGGSPGEEARKVNESEHSWQATARLTAELRARGAVPELYARQTLEAANEELEKLQKQREHLSQ